MSFLSRRKFWAFGLVAVMVIASIVPVFAASTTKKLSSNFTLVNLGTGTAKGQIQYKKQDGTDWRAAESFEIAQVGGQLIRRQYDNNSGLDERQGSVVVSADQPLGAVVQLQAREAAAKTSGAYSGISNPAAVVYVPLVVSKLSTASGLGNSQIIIQNTGSSKINVDVDLVDANGNTTFTKSFSNGSGIEPSASTEYDLADEGNLPNNWFGSAVVKVTTPGGTAGVVSNFFTGADPMQTFNGFANPAEKHFLPLVTSRLANSLSGVTTVQNLSGNTIPAGSISLNCKAGAGSPGGDFAVQNPADISNSAGYSFNPVNNITPGFPDGWYGSCILTSTGFPTIVIEQLRFVTSGKAATYEGIPAGGTNKTVIVPLVARRLGNGFASNVAIQNLDEAQAATVTIQYIPSDEYKQNVDPNAQTVTINNVSIPAGSSIQHNHRVEDGVTNAVPQIPEGWYGSMVVTSDRAIDSFVQLDFLSIKGNTWTGDTYMAHNGFTKQ